MRNESVKQNLISIANNDFKFGFKKFDYSCIIGIAQCILYVCDDAYCNTTIPAYKKKVICNYIDGAIKIITKDSKKYKYYKRDHIPNKFEQISKSRNNKTLSESLELAGMVVILFCKLTIKDTTLTKISKICEPFLCELIKAFDFMSTSFKGEEEMNNYFTIDEMASFLKYESDQEKIKQVLFSEKILEEISTLPGFFNRNLTSDLTPAYHVAVWTQAFPWLSWNDNTSPYFNNVIGGNYVSFDETKMFYLLAKGKNINLDSLNNNEIDQLIEEAKDWMKITSFDDLRTTLFYGSEPGNQSQGYEDPIDRKIKFLKKIKEECLLLDETCYN